jgi:hypothetical protein
LVDISSFNLRDFFVREITSAAPTFPWTCLALRVKQRAVLGEAGMTHNFSSGALDGLISIKGF